MMTLLMFCHLYGSLFEKVGGFGKGLASIPLGSPFSDYDHFFGLEKFLSGVSNLMAFEDWLSSLVWDLLGGLQFQTISIRFDHSNNQTQFSFLCALSKICHNPSRKHLLESNPAVA